MTQRNESDTDLIRASNEERVEAFMGIITDFKKVKKPKLSKRFDHRSEVKLKALYDAKLRAANAKATYESVATSVSKQGDIKECSELDLVRSAREEWFESEKMLSRAFQQAIKYVGRTKEPDAASTAQDLLTEMLERVSIPPTQYPLDEGNDSEVAASTKLKLGVMSNMLKGSTLLPTSLRDVSEVSHLLPSNSDFHNVLHSWASSKARKKGLYAEALLLRMAELASWYPAFFLAPTSEAFSLVVKSHAGSTHSHSLKKIVNLHKIHDVYADFGVPRIIRGDPFFLQCSLKALKNYRSPEQLALAEKWLSELHSFATNPENVHNRSANVQKEANGLANAEAVKLDLTGTYTAVIRGFAGLCGTAGAADRARSVLDKMHGIVEMHSDVTKMTVKCNAYDLVLGLYRDSKEERHKMEALALLEEMIAEWQKQCLDGTDVSCVLSRCAPFPSEKSFAFVIQALAHISDKSAARKKCWQLLDEVETMYESSGTHFSVPTNAVYNAALESLIKIMANDSELIDEVRGIMDRMESVGLKIPGVKPDATSWSLLLKAYSLLSCEDDHRSELFERVLEIFKELNDNPSMAVTDNCYYHMMKCTVRLVPDENEKRDRILELFLGACEKGLVSANVLRMFRINVSEDVFVERVGTGRLADNWLANVTSYKALYTDGTAGGAGKNARRKGKSTSDWAKKQKKEEFKRQGMAAAK
eukprot:CAMPEP_0113557394 /NCGR_PEP_ID=MMETSP0015_2-20120614/17770_1 /TAXON_ID=2838 /ORGANISM="Odontella" /LENGTH=702 /DNA_ID=CAMNT_0000458821 /DNA_START=314 /DNA_END=2419 /DNA_ORIENTATION=- /assembly_acc=CAM_ASM_000160